MSLIPVTVVIPALDEAGDIADCIRSVAWAAEVIVVDGGSEDSTVERAGEAGARVMVLRGGTIGEQRNTGIAVAANDWVLALDADERAEETLPAAVAASVSQPPERVYSVGRRNRFDGRVIRWGRWGGDRVTRLFPATERYDGRPIHEQLDTALPVARLDATISHEPYRDLAEFEMKLRRYSRLAARELQHRSVARLRCDVRMRPTWRLFSDLMLKAGILNGIRGVRLAALGARSVREKYRAALALKRNL